MTENGTKRRTLLKAGIIAPLAFPATGMFLSADDNHNLAHLTKPVLNIKGIKGRIKFRHSNLVIRTGFGPKDIFEHSVIEFRENGEVSFPSGLKLVGNKGDKFKLVCIRDAGTMAIRKIGFSKALTLEELRQKITARKEGR